MSYEDILDLMAKYSRETFAVRIIHRKTFVVAASFSNECQLIYVANPTLFKKITMKCATFYSEV